MTAAELYDLGWRSGAIGIAPDPEFTDESAYRRGYRHGVRDHRHAVDSFLAPPERPSDHGHEVAPPTERTPVAVVAPKPCSVWPSRAVTALFEGSTGADDPRRA